MRLAVAAAAVAGVLAIGAVPAVAFTLAAAEKPDAAADTAQQDQQADKPGNGPPAHAQSRHNSPGKEKGDQREKADKALRSGKGGHRHAQKMVALAMAHAEGMREWAGCVADAAREHDSAAGEFRPEQACGEKPAPPGHLKRR